MNKKKLLLISALAVSATGINAQTTSSYNLTAFGVPDVVIPYDITDEGKRLPIKWGMDTAWANEQNMRKGIAHIGSDNISLARVSFTPWESVESAQQLPTTLQDALDNRLYLIGLIGRKDLEVMLNDDHATVDESYTSDSSGKNWAKLMKMTMNAIERSGYKVTSIAPFNEPDYGWGQGGIVLMRAVCEQLKTGAYAVGDDVRISAGNTLNCDQASYWYNYMKPYVDEGNTHQLAGSFDNYAAFFTEVRNDGNVATADELHNVGEAIVGVEYGMQNGIWWGFDAFARGEFCRTSNQGRRLAYGEDRADWTVGCVYYNDSTDKVQAFLGSSERQAVASSYLFVSKDRDVYYDGEGPLRDFYIDVPGGASGSYQNGQTNAERVIDITYGEDVQPSPINGTYLIMNRFNRKVLTVSNGGGSGSALEQANNKGLDYQKWTVVPNVPSETGGDFSYHNITSARSGYAYPIDVLNFSMSSGAKVILYNGDYSSNEQWRLVYEGNGCYTIRNRESGLCLDLESKNSKAGTKIVQRAYTGENRQLWKFIPVDAACELTAPDAPTGLTYKNQPGSIRLSWNNNTEEDLAGYMVLRKDVEAGYWNTIARKVTDTVFYDNTCVQGKEYRYKIRAIDYSENLSSFSDSVTTKTDPRHALICQLQFDDSLSDNTENHFDCVYYGTPNFSSVRSKSGTKSLYLDGGTGYAKLPYALGSMSEMTFCSWVYSTDRNSIWQRIFDFGNGTGEYMFLSPYNGSVMRFAITDGSGEQQLDIERLGTGWHHIALTMGADSVAIYVDGELAGSTRGITLRPSDINPVMCYLGRSQFPADPYFKGYLDDVRFYNYPLSQDEITEVMNDLGAVSTSIESITTDAKAQGDGNTHYYDLNGRKMDTPSKGINIVKSAEGDVKKVLVK